MMNQEIPEEPITDILRRLPIAACLARFCCVSKSWSALLSDPSFILHRHKPVDPHLAIMINVVGDNQRSVYSLYSADTLEPLLPPPVLQLPEEAKRETDDGDRDFQVAGSCNGLVCISDCVCELILWNPATSETKLLPPSSFYRRRNYLHLNTVGFGFDSGTNDYKIVRQFEYDDDDSWGYDDDSWGCHYLSEVYSLRNDSWTKLNHHGYNPCLPYFQIPQCNKGKLYWWVMDQQKRNLQLDSFDISSPELEKVVDLSCPSQNLYWRPKCLLDQESMVALFPLYEKQSPVSCRLGRYGCF